MKIHFFILALLCLIHSSPLIANNVDGNVNPSAIIEAEVETKSASIRKHVETIPGKTLKVSVDQDLLKVDLSGNTTKLDWILFQPQGSVISRLNSSSNIDQIMIGNLKEGTYVLMLKDEEGRILTETFVKA